ncbi:MAG: hypothetical protein O3A65_05905 [Proteobacteria bacterium]|nr:hypothetical protein [Pseudomonadota bacterium]
MKIVLSLFAGFFILLMSLPVFAATGSFTDDCVSCPSVISHDIWVVQAQSEGDELNPLQEQRRRDRPRGAFRSDLMFKFLIAEFAKHNKLYELSAETLVDILRSEERSDIAEMAADAANVARRLDLALEAAKIWFRLEPDSLKAKFVYLTVILRNNEFDVARPLVLEFLVNNDSAIDTKLKYVGDLVGSAQDREGGYRFFLEVTLNTPDSLLKSLLLGQSALRAGFAQEASKHADEALVFGPRSEDAALLRASALRKIDSAQSITFLFDFLESHPEAGTVRASVVEDLIREERYEDAIPHLQRMAQDDASNANVRFTLALVMFEVERYDESKHWVHLALSLGYEDRASTYFQLGLIDEKLNSLETAANWFSSVPKGGRFIEAQSHLAKLKLASEGLESTIDYLNLRASETPEYFVAFVELQGMIYRDSGKLEKYFSVLDDGLKIRLDEPSLLYSSAMAAEQIGRLDILEIRLRRLMELQPNNAQAYNALGYTLVDKTDRFEEAKTLLVRALELSPDDPVFIDSMGWIEFKLKNYDKSIALLQRAYELERHPEIAAHLGEALWAIGHEVEAKSVWRFALDQFPENDVLLDTAKRYGVD